MVRHVPIVLSLCIEDAYFDRSSVGTVYRGDIGLPLMTIKGGTYPAFLLSGRNVAARYKMYGGATLRL